MATKTVINSNATTTRGISITIDQAQQQQQHTDCISSATSKIAISPNISTAYTANDVGQRHQRCNNGNKLETNLTNTTRYSTTFIDINRNEDDDQNTKTGRTTRPKQQNIVEKESTTMSTFSQPTTTTTATATATTSSQEPVNNGTETPLIVLSERRKTKVNEEEEEEAMKKAEATTTNGLGKVASNFDDDQCISISHIGGGNGTDVGICITHEQYHTESTKLTKHDNDDDVLTTTTTTVIACNNNNNNDDEQQHEHHERYDHRVLNEHHKDIINDNDDDDVVESCLGDGGSGSSSGEYFSNISVGANNGSCLTVAAAAPNSPFLAQLENNIVAAHNTTKRLEIEIDPDCASALTETLTNADQPNSLVVKIKISPNEHNDDDGKENTNTTVVSSVSENTLASENKSKVTVVQLNSNAAAVQKTPPQLKLKILEDKMVQKPCAAQNGQSNGNTTNGNTTITELNVPPNQSSSPSSSYLYYMMSSGQFSPCDTLDSGTGSDLECNVVSNSPPPPPAKMQNNSTAPKLELHLKTTKIRVNTAAPNGSAANTNKDKPLKAVVDKTNEHLRAGSLTDSEESESSLSCDSLNSSEFLRLHSNSPSVATPGTPIGKSNGTFLPDSLLRDIRDRKYPTNDFVSKYVDNNNPTIYECVVVEPQTPIPTTMTPLPTTLNFAAVQEAVAHAKYVRERNNSNLFSTKRASMPKKTFVLNASDGSFVDTKMNSMPRKYEADKYYNFHVNEHENFRSFGNGSIGNNADLSDNGGDGCSEAGSWTDYESKSLSSNDDAFAGYKDIRCNSAASTIRSSKGTVRGVKNRVRNGIATFLQLQQPNVKNYKEKDLGKVVLYTTSMGIIRETFAKCSNVKQILRTLLVKFEERDVFMSVEYQQEIKERMHSEAIKVPQLFVEGQHIGDAETVERLNESGELRQLLKPYKSIATTYTCQTCGGYRLLPCPSCNGSKKSVHRNHFTAEFVALKCMNCDEVGLVKCHNC